MLDNYNERLFNGKSLRSKLHIARYKWLQKKIKKYHVSTKSVVELGCFDGKTIDFLETKPSLYDGYDANWENGLDKGREKWRSCKNYHFHLSTNLADFNPKNEFYDVGICQETAEHLPVQDLDTYLQRLAKATNSYCFFSVPNERGFIFALKHFIKFLTQPKNQREGITMSELIHTLSGRLNMIERDVKYHKGFDYHLFKKQLVQYFEILEINGLPFDFLPPSLSFTVGIVCKKKEGKI